MEKKRKDYPWRRRQRKMVLAIVLIFVVIPVTLIALRKYQDFQFERTLQTVRDAGFPATVQELGAYYPTPPAEQNAADLYQQSFDAKAVSNDPRFREIEKQTGEVKKGRFAEELHKLAEEYLAANVEKLRILHEAAKLPACRFPLDFSDGSNLKLPHLAQLRASLRLLSLEAMLAAEDGDMNRALDSLLTAFTVSKAVRQEPLLISQLVRIACDGIACFTVRRAMELGSFSEAQLAQLAAVLKHSEDPEAMIRGLAGERVFQLMLYDNPQLFTNDLNKTVHGAGTAAGVFLKITGALNRDCDFYLRMMDQMIAACRMPAHEAMPVLRRIGTNIQASSSWIPSPARIQLPAFTQVMESRARDEAILRNTAAAVAIERYRIVYNRLPEQLADLAPSFLETVPVDPFDGKPLRYRRLDAGYVVYSVGYNLKDEEGAEPPEHRNPRETGDITFRLER